jgi:hypothetical protein
VLMGTDWASLSRVEYLERRLAEAVGASDAALRDDQLATARSWEDTATKLRRDLDDARAASATEDDRLRRLTALDPRDVARRVCALATLLVRLAPAEARACAEAILAALPQRPAGSGAEQAPGEAAVGRAAQVEDPPISQDAAVVGIIAESVA